MQILTASKYGCNLVTHNLVSKLLMIQSYSLRPPSCPVLFGSGAACGGAVLRPTPGLPLFLCVLAENTCLPSSVGVLPTREALDLGSLCLLCSTPLAGSLREAPARGPMGGVGAFHTAAPQHRAGGPGRWAGGHPQVSPTHLPAQVPRVLCKDGRLGAVG